MAPTKPEAALFILAAVIVEGASVFDPAEFAPFYEGLLAQEVSIADIETILAKITKKYRDGGYILSRAIAPLQQLETGVLRINIIEGYVDRVVYKGADGKTAILAPYAERIKADRPLRIATLERNILLINDIGGIGVDSKLQAVSEAEGRYALVLNVSHKPVDGLAYLNNRGTPSAGRLQSWVSAGLNSLLGRRERVQFGFFTVPTQPEELLYFEASYTQPIGSDGLHASIRASVSDLDSGSELDATDVESASTNVHLRAWYPIIRRSKHNLWLTGDLHYQDFRETTLGQTTTADRLRALRVQLNYWRRHNDGSTSISLEASQGFNILDATEIGAAALSRADGRSDYTKFNASITRQQGLFGKFDVQASLGAQWSAHPLLSAEEFALGGTNFGRAYDFSEVTGENGVAGAIELRYGDNLGKPWLNAYQLYGFYDIGAIWNHVSGDDNSRDSISSIGLGARLTLTPKIRVNLEAANPLTRGVDTRSSTAMRYFFSITASF